MTLGVVLRMSSIPRDRTFDATLAVLRRPFEFISSRCRRAGTDVFATRVILQRVICMTGPEAVELFYDESRFVRQGALPLRLRKTLFGQNGVQTLDDEEHRHRRAMLLSILAPDRVGLLAGKFREELERAARRWTGAGTVVLYDALREALFRAVTSWAGIPVAESDVARRTEEMRKLYAQATALGPRHWESRRARRSAEAWMRSLVRRVRSGALPVRAERALRVIAWHEDPGGELLAEDVAAVELLNLVRPTVAASVFLTHAAHALHQNPAQRPVLEAEGKPAVDRFVQEVRRFYPFFPFVGARVRESFQWNGWDFARGTLALLDLYGINHDPRVWEAPREFRPERFAKASLDESSLVPQGGGPSDASGHRCAGEPLTRELMRVGIEFLTTEVAYEVPPQELAMELSRLPPVPASGFRIRRVRPRAKSGKKRELRASEGASGIAISPSS